MPPAGPRIAILGNSGSGKSTLARWIARAHDCPVLDLDTVAWEPGRVAVARDPVLARAEVRRFASARDAWVVEGCYAGLIEVALERATLLVYADPGTERCLAHCLARPWEPHKYASREEQDRQLEFLLGWVRDYDARAGELGRAAHEALFAAHPARKRRLSRVLRDPADAASWLAQDDA